MDVFAIPMIHLQPKTTTHTSTHPKCSVATYCTSSLSHNNCDQQWISQNGTEYIMANALGW